MGYMSPILNPPSRLPPIPSLRVIPVHQPWAPCLKHRTWTGDLFYMIIHMFQSYSLRSSHPRLSHRVQRSVLYIRVSSAVLRWHATLWPKAEKPSNDKGKTPSGKATRERRTQRYWSFTVSRHHEAFSNLEKDKQRGAPTANKWQWQN